MLRTEYGCQSSRANVVIILDDWFRFWFRRVADEGVAAAVALDEQRAAVGGSLRSRREGEIVGLHGNRRVAEKVPEP